MAKALDDSPPVSGTPVQKRQNTREKLLRAALALISEDRGGLAGLSLREITRKIGVSPTAFYRHFPGMEALGLELINESCDMLRRLLRDVRKADGLENLISSSVSIFLSFVREHRETFVMVARERAGGSEKMRAAIRVQMTQFATEMATDLRLINAFPRMAQSGLQRVAAMGISIAVNAIPEVLDIPNDNSEMEREMARELENQLQLIFIGASHWEPGGLNA